MKERFQIQHKVSLISSAIYSYSIAGKMSFINSYILIHVSPLNIFIGIALFLNVSSTAL